MVEKISTGEVIDGRFQVQDAAIHGGMAAVYRAIDLERNEAVAIKILTLQGDAAARRFLREAKVLEELNHPAIARYFGYGLTKAGNAFIAMEWLEGEELADYLARGPLTPKEAVALFTRIAEAVAFVHARGIVHRDIKPSNLYLRGRRLDDVVLLDFGVARLQTQQQLTTPGALLGTPQYMSPEQARAASNSGPPADIFSLGCVLFECLSGRPAFEGAHIAGVLAKILLDDLPPLRTVCPSAPVWLEELLARMVAKQPEQRPKDGAELLTTLQKAAGEQTRRMALPPVAMTRQSRHLLSVVLLDGRPKGAPLHVNPNSSTQDGPPTFADGSFPLALLVEAALQHGASVEIIAGGTVACLLWGSAVARDQATQAARLALGLQAIAPGCPMALSTGHAELGGEAPLGEAIDRAALLLRAALDAGGALFVDDVTASFLDGRFELLPGKNGHELVGEREQEDPTRTLLGRPTTFLGREEEFDAIVRTVSESISAGAARAVLVTAPAGIGKSRLCHELLRYLRAAGNAEVLFAQGDARRAGSAHSLLVDLVRRASGFSEGQAADHKLRKLRARLSRNLPAAERAHVLEFLGELAGLPSPAPSPQLRAARQNPLAFGDQLRLALRDWFVAESAARPLVLILDDLHWGDLPSVRALDAALRVLAKRPFVVIGFGRPETLQLFPGLWEAHRRWHLPLAGLPRLASEALVREILGDAPDLAERLADQSGGNAFFLEELIRASAQHGSDGKPQSALAMIESRIALLPELSRDVLRAASVLGDVFWPSGVAALLGLTAELLPEAIRALQQEEMIRRNPRSRFAPEPEYAFRHSLVREAAYQTLTDGDRRLGHQLAGEWLLSKGERDPVTLAEHFQLGTDPLRAQEWYRFAATQAMEGEDFARVLSLCRRGSELGAEDALRGEFEMLESEALIWSGRYSDAGERGQTAMERLPPGSVAWWTAGGTAAVGFGRSGMYPQLAALSDLFLRQAPSPGTGRPKALAQARAALWLWSSGRYAQARAQTDACLSHEEELRADPAYAAQAIHEVSALRALYEGEIETYFDEYQSCLRCYEDAGYLRQVSRVLSELTGAYCMLGEAEEGLTLAPRALALAEQLQMPAVAAFCHQRRGQALYRLQRYPEAIDALRSAAETFQRGNLPLQEGITRGFLSLTLLQVSQQSAAEREARRGVEASLHIPTTSAFSRACLAWALLARGRNQEARAEASLGYERLLTLGSVGEGDLLVRLAYIESLLLANDSRAAMDALAEARLVLYQQARRIRSQERQLSFLQGVLENERTLSLARNWLGEEPTDEPG
jgi:tetratricopeptide (TPR) repeat protein/predicted Ser/Thr protein kinase